MVLDDLTDEQLVQLAGSLGINHGDFMVNPPAGVLNFNQPVSSTFGITPEVRNLVGQEFNAQRTLGSENIKRAALESAGSRGLTLEDSPIGDPYLRAIALLESQLGGQEAQSVLGLGQNQQQFQETSLLNRTSLLDQMRKSARAQSFLESQAAKDFDLSIADFQNRLQQQAFQNRLQLSTTLGNMGLGLSGQRQGITPGSTTTAPPDVAGGFSLISRGGQAATLTPTSSNLFNSILANQLGLGLGFGAGVLGG